MDKAIDQRKKMKVELAATNSMLAARMQSAERAEIQHLLEQMEQKIGLIIKNRNHDKDSSPLDIMLDTDGKISVVPPHSDQVGERALEEEGGASHMPENLDKAWLLLTEKYKAQDNLTFNPVNHVVHIK